MKTKTKLEDGKEHHGAEGNYLLAHCNKPPLLHQFHA